MIITVFIYLKSNEYPTVTCMVFTMTQTEEAVGILCYATETNAFTGILRQR